MPNWVNNTLVVNGDAESIKAFKEKASRTYQTAWKDEAGAHQSVLHFWSFKRPPQGALDSGEYWGAHNFSGTTENNWYNWNNREWGTKWDACDAELSNESPTHLQYWFNTAWSIPEPVFVAMVEQHPELTFELHSTEEQGWGAEYVGEKGEVSIVDEWDIPATHAESMKRMDSCHCEWLDANDAEERAQMFDDCPTKIVPTSEAIKLLEEAEAKMSVG